MWPEPANGVLGDLCEEETADGPEGVVPEMPVQLHRDPRGPAPQDWFVSKSERVFIMYKKSTCKCIRWIKGSSAIGFFLYSCEFVHFVLSPHYSQKRSSDRRTLNGLGLPPLLQVCIFSLL